MSRTPASPARNDAEDDWTTPAVPLWASRLSHLRRSESLGSACCNEAHRRVSWGPLMTHPHCKWHSLLWLQRSRDRHPHSFVHRCPHPLNCRNCCTGFTRPVTPAQHGPTRFGNLGVMIAGQGVPWALVLPVWRCAETREWFTGSQVAVSFLASSSFRISRQAKGVAGATLAFRSSRRARLWHVKVPVTFRAARRCEPAAVARAADAKCGRAGCIRNRVVELQSQHSVPQLG